MWEKQLRQRLLVIAAVLVIAAILIYPPQEKLRPGLDIAGGVSMVFEIQEDEDEYNPQLAEDMKTLLQRRVDPQGVYDLRWRVHGTNRIEVQMPLPPEDAARLRAEYVAALERVFEGNVRRGALEDALREPADRRPQVLERLAYGSEEELALLNEAAEAYDGYAAALAAVQEAEQAQGEGSGAVPAELEVRLRDASEALDDAIDAALARNLSEQRFTEVLEMAEGSPRRTQGLKDFKERYPERADLIDSAVEKFDTWRKRRTFLDGPADLRRLLRGAGVLEFRILADPNPENITRYDRYRQQLRDHGPRPQPGDTEQWFRIDNPMAFLNLDSPAALRDYDPRVESRFIVDRHDDQWYVLAKRGPEHGLLHGELTGGPWKLKSVGMTRDQIGRRAVQFNLDPYGGQLFRRLTGDNIGRQLCIFVDDLAYSAATIQDEIGASGIISGDFSSEKIAYLIRTMQAGSLPGRLKDTPVSERTIGSSLGQTNLQLAFRAGMIGLALVCVVMLVYYRLCGAVACVALILNVFFVLAVMAMLGARFTLAGIAGVILTLGMAVDANVLIFERMREERERGASLRMIIKNGYDKAFSTIFDSNITTLLTSMIIYYVGSEEIKGFGLTLGWGVVISMFTALYVTRTLFTLLSRAGIMTDASMLKLIGTPKIDWYGKRKYFIPLSVVTIFVGLGLLYMRGTRDALDVEFLGGVEAEIAFKPAVAEQYDDRAIRDALSRVGREIAERGVALASATVTPVESVPFTYRVHAPGLPSAILAAMITEPLEDQNLLQRQGVTPIGGEDAVQVRVQETVTGERIEAAVRAMAGRREHSVTLDGDNIARANVGAVLDAGEGAGRSWNITTTATNKALVHYALVAAFGESLDIQPRITYTLHGAAGMPVPITDRRLEALFPGLPAGAGNVADYLGGAAIYLTDLTPAVAVEEIKARLRSMRLQPDFQGLPWRAFDVLPISQAGVSPEGAPLYDSIVIAVADPAYPYFESAEMWTSQVAAPELSLVRAALDSEQTLRRVSQFKPQIAGQSQQRALMALILSWGMIIAYMWVRFGKPSYGVAGVVALIHDACVALAFVGISGWLGGAGHPIGSALLIDDFKIDMTIIAALLTIIGYSVNDTIVIFDRIRELRGRLGEVTPELINNAVNQTFARTILTSSTTLMVVLIMYIFGGSSIRGFNYCMIIGVVTGVYSTVAVAGPMLLLGRYVSEKRPSRLAPAPA